MNSENLRRVADAIGKHEIEWLGFNMADFVGTGSEDKTGHGCYTSGCIAGWATALFDDVKQPSILYDTDCCDVGGSHLSLTTQQTEDLFYGHPWRIARLSDVTPQMAINTLRYAADHDIIDWDAANPVKDPAL